MRITFILPCAGMGGGTRVVAIYADHLRRRGHDVLVVSTPSPELPLRRKIKMFLQGKEASPADARSHLDDMEVPHHMLERSRPIEDRDVPDADIVIATWWETAEWVNRLSPRKGAKVYLIQHDERMMHPTDPLQQQGVEKTWSLPMQKITISQWLVDLLKTQTSEQIELIPNSVDHALFRAPPRNKQTIPAVGLMYSTVFFKGVDISLKAIEIARKAVPNLRLIAFGTEEPASGLPLPPGTEYYRHPPQDRIREIYAQCDVWLCGSRSEGFGLPPLEAMACRCPVVSTRVGGLPELIEEGVNGYLLEVGDHEGLANRLGQVLTLSDNEWRCMSDAAYKIATSYTWDDATDLLEKTLEHAASMSRKVELQNGPGRL